MKELQPSASKCFVCGVDNPYGLHIRFYDTGPGEVSANVIISDHFQGLPGVAHGGIVATILDEVTSRVFFTESRIMVTAKMDVRYRKPTPLNTPLKLTGQFTQDKGRICKALGQLIAPDGSVLAEAEAVMVEVSQDYLDSMTQMDKQGWKVYPDDYEKNREEGL